jgi:class 3 adenylate cyclase
VTAPPPPVPEDLLSTEDLAVRTGVTAAHVRELTELGILRPVREEAYTTHDVERIHVADGVHGRGISLEDLARAIRAGFVDFARITDYARPREILVSEEVATRCGCQEKFRAIGPVVLKGVTEPMTRFAANPR